MDKGGTVREPLEAYVGWVRDTALPAWADRGFDRARGRFAERLNWAGMPLPVPHRAMVQARQIYSYASAAVLGWFPGALLAEEAAASLRRDFLRDGPEAGVAFSVDPAGRVVSATRDAYTHAFVLLALAQLHRLTGESAPLRLAEGVARFIRLNLADTLHGGVVDALPSATLVKCQNPQMHLLEAYLALEETAPGRGWLEQANALVALFHDRMAHAGHGVLPEYFSASWAAHPDPAMAGVWEPGHHYEWAWLLDRHGRFAGRETGWRETLDAAARRDGHAPDGLIFDAVNVARQPVGPAHRLWPHAEAIKAGVARHRRGDPSGLPFARQMAGLLHRHFLDTPFPGGWTDRISPMHVPAIDHVPASSLYHLLLAATEAASVDVLPSVAS